MSTFVLVHGAAHGAWCWYKVAARLEAAGHRVITPDLPGHGIDRTPMQGLSINDYAIAVESILNTLDEPAILVAHSLGGLTAQIVAERRPEKIRSIVYLAAIVLSAGHAIGTSPVMSQLFGEISASLAMDVETESYAFPSDVATKLFYSDCDADDIALALRLLTPEPTATLGTTIDVTPDRYGTVRRFGIITQDDVILPSRLQGDLYEQDGITETVTMPTAHSPFLNAPDSLTEHLLDFAGRAQ
ncbi:alpha/beta fold hydrolase [Nocardia sp. NPDC049220]|uniref:alpha/beta fold hydrolase n=1 Tax=Nocardia sp. NPDC049220 TaxID=3155273 RepID=UPI0033E7B845